MHLCRVTYFEEEQIWSLWILETGLQHSINEEQQSDERRCEDGPGPSSCWCWCFCYEQVDVGVQFDAQALNQMQCLLCPWQSFLHTTWLWLEYLAIVHVIDMRGGGRGNFSYPGLAHFVKVEHASASVCECDKKCRQ